MRLVLAIGLMVLTASCANAQAPRADGLSVVSLSERAERVMRPDRLRADLRIEITGPDARQVQATINQRMADALDRARAVASLRAETGFYGVYDERRAGRSGPWRGAQSLALIGREAGDILTLAGQLQEAGFVMSGLRYELTPQAAREGEDAMTAEALTRLAERARSIAMALGLEFVRFATVRVGSVDGGNRPAMFRAQPSVAAAAAAPPVAEPGEITIQLSVDAEALMGPKVAR